MFGVAVLPSIRSDHKRAHIIRTQVLPKMQEKEQNPKFQGRVGRSPEAEREYTKMREYKKEICLQSAFRSGLEGLFVGGVLAATAVFSANRYWRAFNRNLGASGKTALIVTGAAGG